MCVCVCVCVCEMRDLLDPLEHLVHGLGVASDPAVDEEALHADLFEDEHRLDARRQRRPRVVVERHGAAHRDATARPIVPFFFVRFSNSKNKKKTLKTFVSFSLEKQDRVSSQLGHHVKASGSTFREGNFSKKKIFKNLFAVLFPFLKMLR